MRRVSVVMLVAVFSTAPACKSQRASYVAAEKSFKEGMAYLNTEIEEGRMSKARARRYTKHVNAANEALKKWLDLITRTPEGEKPDVPRGLVDDVLDFIEIIEALMLSERK